jgi:hypothetical protein
LFVPPNPPYLQYTRNTPFFIPLREHIDSARVSLSLDRAAFCFSRTISLMGDSALTRSTNMAGIATFVDIVAMPSQSRTIPSAEQSTL